MKNEKIDKKVAVESSSQHSPTKRIFRESLRWIHRGLKKDLKIRSTGIASDKKKNALNDRFKSDSRDHLMGQDNFPLGTFWC